MEILIIKRKAFFILTLLFFSLLFQGSFRYINPAKPNVLFIMVDDLRPEIGSFGSKTIKTPNIDKLSAEATIFTKAYCSVPTCGASRASILSGTRPGHFRFITHDTYLKNEYPNVETLPMVLKKNGYNTISYGKVYHHSDDDKDSWSEVWKPKKNNSYDYLDPKNYEGIDFSTRRGPAFECFETSDENYQDGKLLKHANQKLEDLKKSKQPFFLCVGFMKPHLPFNAPKKYWDMYDASSITLPKSYYKPEGIPKAAFHNSGELRKYSEVPPDEILPAEYAKKLIHGYYASVSYVDAQIGLLLNKLKELNLDQNTIVVLIGDHGWNLGDHTLWNKHCTFNTAVNTPLILKLPKQKAKVISTPVEFVDIFPTIIDIAKIKKPITLEGESLQNFTKNKRKKNYAITKWAQSVLLIKDGFAYTEWYDNDFKKREHMLFDHKSDPLELKNLGNIEEFQQKVKELSSFLKENRGSDFYIDRRINK